MSSRAISTLCPAPWCRPSWSARTRKGRRSDALRCRHRRRGQPLMTSRSRMHADGARGGGVTHAADCFCRMRLTAPAERGSAPSKLCRLRRPECPHPDPQPRGDHRGARPPSLERDRRRGRVAGGRRGDGDRHYAELSRKHPNVPVIGTGNEILLPALSMATITLD